MVWQHYLKMLLHCNVLDKIWCKFSNEGFISF